LEFSQQPDGAHADQQRAVRTAVTRKQVYDAHCVECHGTDGKGDGPASHLMTRACATSRLLQDPLDRKRQRSNRRRLAANGSARTLRIRDARLAEDSA
jgi:hypothetical protein